MLNKVITYKVLYIAMGAGDVGVDPIFRNSRYLKNNCMTVMGFQRRYFQVDVSFSKHAGRFQIAE